MTDVTDSKQKFYFYYESNESEHYIKRVVCIVCREVSEIPNQLEDLHDKRQKEVYGLKTAYRFGSSIYRNETKEKNLPLKLIRKQLLVTARGREIKKPLYSYLTARKENFDDFLYDLREAVHMKSISRDGIRLRADPSQ